MDRTRQHHLGGQAVLPLQGTDIAGDDSLSPSWSLTLLLQEFAIGFAEVGAGEKIRTAVGGAE